MPRQYYSIARSEKGIFNPWDIARSRISDKFKFFRAAQINLGRLIRTGPDHVIRFGSVTAGSANFVV